MLPFKNWLRSMKNQVEVLNCGKFLGDGVSIATQI